MDIIENKARGGTKKIEDNNSYHRSKMQRELIVEKLRDKGYRITKQRLLIIDIILREECSCCKEIYYKAAKIDQGIGAATVYRLMNTLEEIGAINRKSIYKVAYSENCAMENACTVILDDNTTHQLSAQKWNAVVKAGLTAYGYLKNQYITSITVSGCKCEEGTC